ncbi:type II secretion system F family protein [Pelagicoccus mobilis]|uniref:Type II secretion system F family protein n=1 Tax=Pelagicoccus mobilis TaxID=415221 RepID=A0A934VMJ2_9BACT|nr:type II secretion system F family protein [Pelagicoccus mobilis]MBK1875242.1 type II secretion system F family protein [Pelagicoccus mobilis]
MARLSDKQLADWLEQVADGVDSGMEASNAVALAKPLPNDRSEGLIGSFREGASWATVFMDPVFSLSQAEHAILAASERSARIPQAMRKIAESRREAQKVKRRITLALAYPILLLHFAALVFSITYLVSGDVTAFLVSAGMVIVPLWMFVFFVWSLAVYLPSVCLSIARRVPVIASYRMYWESGVLCDVLGSCLSAGLGVEDAWRTAAMASGSPKHNRLCDQVLEMVAQGRKASEAMDSKLRGVPSGFREMYRSGEESGKLDQNLEAAGSRYRKDASNRLLLASVLYPKIVLIGIFGYIAYKIVVLVSDYYEQLMEIGA